MLRRLATSAARFPQVLDPFNLCRVLFPLAEMLSEMLETADNECLTSPQMKATFHTLASADKSPWKEGVSACDELPIRDSGAWIETKHKLLSHYSHLFATGMKRISGKAVFILNYFLVLASA